LQSLAPIRLEEMEAVELLNRKDTKFIFPASRINSVLNRLKDSYRILEVNGDRTTGYHNIYFDTADHFCYLQHHNGRLNRYKIRIRSYVNSGLTFLEIKFKSNRFRTIKNRIQVPTGTTELRDEMKQFIRDHCPIDPDLLQPAVEISFDRVTLVSKDMTERATIDLNLKASSMGKELNLQHLAIAELKQDGIISGSLFKWVLRRNHGTEKRISKYCICLSATHPELRQNTFRIKHHYIRKLEKSDTYE